MESERSRDEIGMGSDGFLVVKHYVKLVRLNRGMKRRAALFPVRNELV